jgi:hypothetical protein
VSFSNARATFQGRATAVVVAASCLSLLLSPLGSAPAMAGPRDPSPPNRVLTVTANLLEGYNDEDVRDMSEMNVFTSRLLERVPYSPDVLLLQEVRSRSARYVAQLLTEKTGYDYGVAADAADDPWRQRNGKVIKSDTAVVINRDTMVQSGEGGYLKTYSVNRKTGKTELKKSAYAFASERDGSVSMPMLSVHLGEKGLADTVDTLVTALTALYPSQSSTQVNLIGGDFNQGAFVKGTDRTVGNPFWRNLTSEPHDQTDAFFTYLNEVGVDYVFARGGVAGAFVDTGYDADRAAGTSGFYSDHQFGWSLVAPDTEGPTAPANIATITRPRMDPMHIKLTWSESRDAVSGDHVRYRVYRSRDNVDFSKVKETRRPLFNDRDVTKGKRYWYRIVALDCAGNPTTSATRSVVAGQG